MSDVPKDLQNLLTQYNLTLENLTQKLQTLDRALLDNTDLITYAVSINAFQLYHASRRLKNTKELMNVVIDSNPLALQYASDDMKNNHDIMFKGIQKNFETFQYLGLELKKDTEFTKKCVNFNYKVTKFICKELQVNITLIKELCEINPKVIKLLPEIYRGYKDILLICVRKKGALLKFGNENLKCDKFIVQEAVNQNGIALKFAHENFKEDLDMICLALKTNISIYKDVSLKNQKNPKIVQQLIKINPYSYHWLSSGFKNNLEIIKCLLENPRSCQALSDKLKSDKKMMITAIERDPFIVNYLPQSYFQDSEIQLLVAKNNSLALKNFQNLQQKIITTALSQNPLSIQFFNSTNLEKDTIDNLIKKDAYVYDYLSEFQKKQENIQKLALNENHYLVQRINQRSLAVLKQQQDFQKNLKVNKLLNRQNIIQDYFSTLKFNAKIF